MISFRDYKQLENTDITSLEAICETFDVGKVEALSKQKAIVKTLTNIEKDYLDIEAIEKEGFKYEKDIEKLTFAQFISIESSIQSVRDSYGLVVMVVAQILRPLSEEVYSNDDEGLNEAHRLAIMELPADIVLLCFNRFMKSRETFHFKKYKDVFFYSPEEDDEEKDEESIAQQAQENTFYKNWYWYSQVRTLAGEDIGRYEEILLMKMELIAPEISYRQGLAKVQKQEQAERDAVMRAKSRR